MLPIEAPHNRHRAPKLYLDVAQMLLALHGLWLEEVKKIFSQGHCLIKKIVFYISTMYALMLLEITQTNDLLIQPSLMM